METRRLIRFGKNSYVISLPKGWVEANKLKKGAELFLEEKPGNVIISSTRAAQQERAAHISCEGKRIEDLQTEITSYYKAGCTTLVIEGRNLHQLVPDIKDYIHNLAGAEIIEQSRTRLVVKDLIDIQQVALPTLINRMDMMVRSMFQDALSIEGIDPQVLRDRDHDLNRLQLLVARIVRSVLENPAIGNLIGISIVDAHHLDDIAWSLERIGDYVKRANGDILRSSPAARKELRRFLKEAYDLYLLTMKNHYNRASEAAVKLHTDIVLHLSEFAKQVQEVTAREEVLALENIKNILRDLRIILRRTIEMREPAQPKKGKRQET
jgi:phosphate uptake regulator